MDPVPFKRRSGEAAVVVAVPVKNEVEHIGACLWALTLQSERPPDGIVLAINNTDDGTAATVRLLLPALPVPVTVVECWFPPEQASAGSARRMAMERAAAMLDRPGDVLLTTDADSRVPPNWIAANLSHLRNGVEAVAGRAVLDPLEAALIPPKLHEDNRAECAYASELDALSALLDPELWDPTPRHTEHCGASIAVSLAAYRRAGGMSAAALAEDRHFFAALRHTDARIRHAAEIAVVVSGRTVGRAEGGMADTIRRRLKASDPYLDDALEPAAIHVLRAELRGCFRRAWVARRTERERLTSLLARGLELPLRTVHAVFDLPYCGEAWSALEAKSLILARRLVPAEHVWRELAEARRLRSGLTQARVDQPTIVAERGRQAASCIPKRWSEIPPARSCS